MIESGNNDGFWKERRKIQRDETTDWMVTKNDEGQRLYDPEENKRNIANYYENLYKREVVKPHEYHVQTERDMIEYKQNRLHESEDYNAPPSYKVIEKAIANKKDKKSTTDIKNEFLKRGGQNLVKSIYHVISIIWQEETVPSQWNESIITSVWKNKGDREMMKNQRGISVSSSIGMIMEEIINNRILETIQFTQAQGGGIKNYSTCDHVFLVRSLITYSMKMHKNLIITFYDVEKAYDHAEREDMMHILWKKGVRGKLWRMTCALNENLTSKIRTPYGLTREIQREVGGKQGGKIMTTTFAKTMDMISEDMIENDQVGVTIKDLKIPSLLFVDDLTTISDNYQKQQTTLNEVSLFATKHCLSWGADKSAVMEIGKHTNVKPTWQLGELEIHHQNTYKYLGDEIERDGKNGKNIQERFKKIKKSTCSIITCGKSDIMKRIEVKTMIKLHESVNNPILLHNCESWVLTKTDYLNLEKIELWALKRMLSLPRTTPSIAIRYVTGTLYTRVKIDARQLLFLWKTLRRTPDSWPRQLLMTLDQYNLGWAKQIRETLSDYGVEESWGEIEKMEKHQWKTIVGTVTEKKNRELMIRECYKDRGRRETKTKTKSIIKKLESGEYERKPLPEIVNMNKLHSKAIIMGRYGMLECARNFQMKYGKKACQLCGTEDTEEHRLNICPKWMDPNNDWDPVRYSDIYSNDADKLKDIAKAILKKWEIDNGKNQMKL